MSTQINTPHLVSSESQAAIVKIDEQRRLYRIAYEAAEHAGEKEQRFEKRHNIFIKQKKRWVHKSLAWKRENTA